MSKWPKYRIKDVCSVTSSTRIRSSEYQDDGIPFYRGKEIIEKQRGALKVSTDIYIPRDRFEEVKRKGGVPKGGELLLTSVGTLGVPYVVREGEEFYFKDGNLTWFRELQGLQGKYLYYWLLSPLGKAELKKCVIGSSQPAYTIVLLKEMEIDCPPLQIQHQITEILSAYDDLIENNTRRIEILEEMARRLYEEWFVQFRFPGHEEVEFKETELGLIPQGWQLLRLGDCVELAYGKALKAQDRVPGDYPVYGSSGVVGTHCESLVDGPGIIVGRKGNVGSVFWSDVSFFPIDTTYYVRSDVPLSYLYFNLQKQRFLNNDAAVPGLNREQAYALPFLLPDKDLLSRFSSEWESFYGLLQRLGRANVNLRAQRDLLLPKLISGEIDVSDIPMPT